MLTPLGQLLHEFPTPAAGAAAPAAPVATLPGPICLDAHAHLHPVWSLGTALRAALGHARRAGAGTCVLCLSRTPAENAFERLAAGEAAAEFDFEAAPEPGVLVACGDAERADPTLVLVDGRQLVTVERIEVLALAAAPASAEAFSSGLPLAETLAAVAAADAVPVLPHGVGKWLGRRGRMVSRVIDAAAGRCRQEAGPGSWETRLCLADNAGRLTVGPRPPIFDQAAALGITVLAGSDPLPVPGGGTRLGGFGVVLDQDLPLASVAATLRARLPMLGPTPRRFGSHAGFGRSLLEQAALRLLGRRQKAPQRRPR